MVVLSCTLMGQLQCSCRARLGSVCGAGAPRNIFVSEPFPKMYVPDLNWPARLWVARKPQKVRDRNTFMNRPILDEAASASYELSEAEYADNEAGNTWVQRLLGSLVAVLQWLQPLLTPNNYDTLVSSILEKASPARAAGKPRAAVV